MRQRHSELSVESGSPRSRGGAKDDPHRCTDEPAVHAPDRGVHAWTIKASTWPNRVSTCAISVSKQAICVDTSGRFRCPHAGHIGGHVRAGSATRPPASTNGTRTTPFARLQARDSTSCSRRRGQRRRRISASLRPTIGATISRALETTNRRFCPPPFDSRFKPHEGALDVLNPACRSAYVPRPSAHLHSRSAGH